LASTEVKYPLAVGWASPLAVIRVNQKKIVSFAVAPFQRNKRQAGTSQTWGHCRVGQTRRVICRFVAATWSAFSLKAAVSPPAKKKLVAQIYALMSLISILACQKALRNCLGEVGSKWTKTSKLTYQRDTIHVYRQAIRPLRHLVWDYIQL
jgi:hypothetical protein